MSHVTGTVQSVSPARTLGPDHGPATNPPSTWALSFAWAPAPKDGTKLVMLHFTGASFPGNNRLEVDLGYGGQVDVFTAADGTDFWTRPINVYAFPSGAVPIRYITSGASTGGVQLDKYGRGERHAQEPGFSPSYSNCDPFLDPGSPLYVEPEYATFAFCNGSPSWENVDCVNSPNDVRKAVAPSVGLLIHVEYDKELGFFLSTCTVTLVGPDTVLTAGHCMDSPMEHAESGSVIFGYQTQCGGDRPNGYSPSVYKVKAVIAQKYADGTSRDYCLVRLKTPVSGITPVPMRKGLPALGEKVFGLHHPNGAVKKLSPPHPGYATIAAVSADGIGVDLDVSGGSSGSGLFDTAGRIVGVLSNAGPCQASYDAIALIQEDMAAPAPATRDVMVVFDRSGSMSLPGTSGRSKLAEAQAATSLFVQLVRAGTGNRVGLVSFSTTARSPVDFALSDVTAASKTTLIGNAPYNAGIVGGLVAGGSTTIGGGLNAAYAQLVAGANRRNVLLLTDGMQNTPPLVDPNDRSPTDVVVDVIGYGTPSSLDGTFLTALATSHNGQYVLADTDLKLQKFFAQAFGNIFESGLLVDPELVLPEGQKAAAPLPFQVCQEEAITVVVGWSNPSTRLRVELLSPSGARVNAASPGAEGAFGDTWAFLRAPLPQGGERDGTWKASVFRAAELDNGGKGMPEVRYFVNVVASGGAVLRRMPDRNRYYTGDAINPRVGLQYRSGGLPPNARVRVTISRPDGSVGTLLSKEKLGNAAFVDSDSIPPRQATLQSMEQRTGKAAVGYTQHTFDLFDDMARSGALEPAGIFGNPLQDVLAVEGHYTFHFQATYGAGCTATRELFWSLNVEPGIDAGRTEVTADITDGKGTMTFTPRDRYGNHLGPGMAAGITVVGAPGTTVTGLVQDNGDGSYTARVECDPGSSTGPGLVLGQPGRTQALIAPEVPPKKGGTGKAGGAGWKGLFWLTLIIAVILLLLWITK